MSDDDRGGRGGGGLLTGILVGLALLVLGGLCLGGLSIFTYSRRSAPTVIVDDVEFFPLPSATPTEKATKTADPATDAKPTDADVPAAPERKPESSATNPN